MDLLLFTLSGASSGGADDHTASSITSKQKTLAEKSQSASETTTTNPHPVLNTRSDDTDARHDPFCLLPHASGWKSGKCCNYPQELILELDADASVKEVSLESVGPFAPSRVELYAGVAGSPRHQRGVLKTSSGSNLNPTGRAAGTTAPGAPSGAENYRRANASRTRPGGGGQNQQQQLFTTAMSSTSTSTKSPFDRSAVSWEKIGEFSKKSSASFVLRQYSVPHNGWLKLVLFRPPVGAVSSDHQNPYSRVLVKSLEIWGEVFQDTRKLLAKERAAKRLRGLGAAAPGAAGAASSMNIVEQPVAGRGLVHLAASSSSLSPLRKAGHAADNYYKPKQPVLEATWMELGLPLEAIPVTARRRTRNQLDSYSNGLAEELLKKQQQAVRNQQPGIAQKLQYHLDDVIRLGEKILQLEEDRKALVDIHCLPRAEKKEEAVRALKREVLEIGAATDTTWWEQQMVLPRPAADEFFRVDFEAKIRQLQTLLEEERNSRSRVNTMLDDAEAKLAHLRKEYEALEDVDTAKQLQISRLEEALLLAREERQVITLSERLQEDRERLDGMMEVAGDNMLLRSPELGGRAGDQLSTARRRMSEEVGEGVPGSSSGGEDGYLQQQDQDGTALFPSATASVFPRGGDGEKDEDAFSFDLHHDPKQAVDFEHSSGTPPRPSEGDLASRTASKVDGGGQEELGQDDGLERSAAVELLQGREEDADASTSKGPSTAEKRRELFKKHSTVEEAIDSLLGGENNADDSTSQVEDLLEVLTAGEILEHNVMERAAQASADKVKSGSDGEAAQKLRASWLAGSDPLREDGDETVLTGDENMPAGIATTLLSLAKLRTERLRDWLNPEDKLFRADYPGLTLRELAGARKKVANARRLERVAQFQRAVRKAKKLSDVLRKFTHREVLENLTVGQILEAGVYDVDLRVAEDLLPPTGMTTTSSSSSGLSTDRTTPRVVAGDEATPREDHEGEQDVQDATTSHSASKKEKKEKKKKKEKKEKKKSRAEGASATDTTTQGEDVGAAGLQKGGKKERSWALLRKAFLGEDEDLLRRPRGKDGTNAEGKVVDEEANLSAEELGRRRISAISQMLDPADPLYREGDRDLTLLQLLQARKKRASELKPSTPVVPELKNFPNKGTNIKSDVEHAGGSGSGTEQQIPIRGEALTDSARKEFEEQFNISAANPPTVTTITDPVTGKQISVLTDPKTGDVVLQDGKPIAVEVDEEGKPVLAVGADGEPTIQLADGSVVKSKNVIRKGSVIERVSAEQAVKATAQMAAAVAQTSSATGDNEAAADAEVAKVMQNQDQRKEEEDVGEEAPDEDFLASWVDEFFWEEKAQSEKYKDLVLTPGKDFPIKWDVVDCVTPRASRAVLDAQPVFGDVFCSAFLAQDWRLQEFALTTLAAHLDPLVQRMLDEGSHKCGPAVDDNYYYAQQHGGLDGSRKNRTGYTSTLSRSVNNKPGEENENNNPQVDLEVKQDTRYVRDLNSARSKRHLVAPSSPQTRRDSFSWSPNNSDQYPPAPRNLSSSWLRESGSPRNWEQRPITMSRIFRVLCDLVLAAVDTENTKRKKVPLQIAAVQFLEKLTTARFVDDIPVRVALACLKKPCSSLIANLLGDANNRLHHVTESCLAAIITQLGPTPVVSALVSHPDAPPAGGRDSSLSRSTARSPNKSKTNPKMTPRLVHLPWRALEARLELLHSLVSICGPPSLIPSKNYSVPNLMPLVITGLNHQMWDVRHLAIEVCTLLFQNVGLKLLPYLQEVPPNLIESLNVRFSEVDAGEYEDEEDFALALSQARSEVATASSPRPRGGAATSTQHGFSSTKRSGAGSPQSSTALDDTTGPGGNLMDKSMRRTVGSLEKRAAREENAAKQDASPRPRSSRRGGARSPGSRSPEATDAVPRRLSEPRLSDTSQAREYMQIRKSGTDSPSASQRNVLVERPPSHSYEDYQLQYENRISRALGRDSTNNLLK
ncbi:unnamed protein product [Amoebophrya sp. A120]|nr:unnamed protein product [Amoebophrya sp. A120]|eukprot:GSA120T00012632001.1